jgi:hypothetical protein
MQRTSGYSYMRVAAIQINVHLAGENPANTPHAFHNRSTYGLRPYVPHVVYVWQPFAGPQQDWTDALLPRKNAPNSTSQLG